ncbi:pumilio domain-containing protein [Phlyctema vagabunda]|uniref:Pumilio domain-containing protein n=1 Tax=Phlyctema vagabunda TaxID=108571 RepID=A0ABR4PXA8_9HELO
MPTATITKSATSGTKRKSAPVKDSQVKDSKKAKTDSGRTKAPIVKKEKLAVRQKVEASDSDSDEGGAPIEEDDEEEPIPQVVDGVHPDRVKAVNTQTSREAHAKQKQLAQERRAAKPLADPLQRTKKIWERLRRKSHVPKEERDTLVKELFEIITGSIKDFVLKHDSVRVVQTAIKYANPDQKRMIANELKGTYRQLAESRYAKFLIGKLLVQGDNEIRDLIVPEFYGHVRKLIKHPEASWILDDVYRGVASKRQKAIILREWYGAEFSLFQKDKTEEISGELSEILAAEPGKRAPIMRSLQELINHLIQKKMTGFTLLHDAMLQYFLNAKAGTEEITDFIELLKGDEEGDLMKNLAFTKSGARVVSLALAYGTAKDRKHILKTYKDTLQMMAADPNGHIVILTAYEVIDDTVLTAKSIFPELLSKDAEKQVENTVFSANDLNARTTLLYPFQGRSKSLFPPSYASDLEILAEIDGIRTTTSKKDPEIRQKELAKALSPFLLKAIASAASDLVTTTFGCQFIAEILFGAEGDKTAALEAIAATAAGDPNFVQPVVEGEEAEEPMPHVAITPFGGKMIKTLIAGGRFDSKTRQVVPVEPALNFADILYPHIKDHIIDWATGSSSFVVLSLIESPSFSEKDEVLKILKDNKKQLKKSATEETPDQKASRESAEAEIAAGKGKKSKTAKKERSIGNKGAALLLEQL